MSPHGQPHLGQCAFACHDYNDRNNYYNLAKTLGVTTRIDVLRSATQSLMDTAAATQTYSNQFRMAIYDFGASSKTIGLRALFSLSSSLSSAKPAAGNIDLMGVYGNKNRHRRPGYPVQHDLSRDGQRVIPPGTGTSSAPLKYLFFVSDGVADEYNTSCLKPTSGGGRCQSPLNPALVHDTEEQRRQDRRALHHLSAAADQRLVHELDRSLQ